MRYEQVTSDVEDVLRNVRNEHFPELAGATILCIFDLKKKMSKGRICLADIRVAKDLEKFLHYSDDDMRDPIDYIIRVDKKAWSLANEIDKKRLIRHELRHTHVEPDKKKPWKLRGHSLEDFYSEIRLNEDDPRWGQTLAAAVESAYEDDREEE